MHCMRIPPPFFILFSLFFYLAAQHGAGFFLYGVDLNGYEYLCCICMSVD